MDLSSKDADEMRQWVKEHWDPSGDLVSWRTQLAESGWGAPSWPEQWFGRGLTAGSDKVSRQILYDSGAVGMASGVSMYLVAPTLLEWATEPQLQRFLLPILTGSHKWCQLFSEPGAGSDLASLATRAERDGDEWVISGQKVWNSGAQKADYGILLARTDFTATKHQGISFFLLPMKQAAVEVRPLHQMNGHSSFNEVFFDEARLPHENLIASQGDGWRVALTTLAHERSAVATPRPKFPLSTSPLVMAAKTEADEYFATYSWYPQRAGRPRLVEPQARLLGKSQIPREITDSPCAPARRGSRNAATNFPVDYTTCWRSPIGWASTRPRRICCEAKHEHDSHEECRCTCRDFGNDRGPKRE